ncbi:unnamed protein product [Dracunculus medinensis]|uniref:Innexin n=1 Tax=Dracunculus medinensis TaxID=318479 RepID=A0A0N4URD7_DRAME|nr:unnamed protein product [Dracunculus medinensis]
MPVHELLTIKHALARSGRNATIAYLLIKFLYLANIVLQLIGLNRFLGGKFSFWAYETITSVATGKQWEGSPVFPRVIMCDFQIRRLGNLQSHTVQCVIMMNMIHEKLYLFLWFWFIFVGICTLINFLYYLLVMNIPKLRANVVLWLMNWQKAERFIHKFLYSDGILMLKLLQEHVNSKITKELVNEIFNIYALKVFIFIVLI